MVAMLCESDLHYSDLSGLEVEHYGCQGKTTINVTKVGDESLGAGFSCVGSPNLKLV